MVSKRVNERNKAQHLYNEWTYEAKKKKEEDKAERNVTAITNEEELKR